MPEISVSIQKTINLGNFENIKVEAGAKTSGEPNGANYEELYQSVNFALERIIEQKLEEMGRQKAAPERRIERGDNSVSRFRQPKTVSEEGS